MSRSSSKPTSLKCSKAGNVTLMLASQSGCRGWRRSCAVAPAHPLAPPLRAPPQRGRERLGVARLLVATAVDEDPGRAAHAALGTAHEVLLHPRRVDVRDELAPHPLRVEPQLARVPHQILVRERRLPLVQEIVHLPELPLRGSRLPDLRGVLGVRVLLTQRKMPEHEPNLADRK